MTEFAATGSPTPTTPTNGDKGDQRYAHTPGFTPPVRHEKPRSKRRLIIIAMVIVCAAVTTGVLYMILSNKKAAPATSSTNTTQSSAQKDTATSQSGTSGPHTYKSAKLNIEFTYPASWAMKENADKTVITLTSPQTTYTKKDGTSASGVFTLRLRNGLVSDTMKQNIQNAVAMKDSEVIAYSSPTDQQRQYTNISFGGTGTNTGFFVVSGSVGFKAGEAFGSSIDLEGAVYLFAGGYGADGADALAFDAVPKASFEGPPYQQALGIVKSMKIY
jgi:hypothetical protein